MSDPEYFDLRKPTDLEHYTPKDVFTRMATELELEQAALEERERSIRPRTRIFIKYAVAFSAVVYENPALTDTPPASLLLDVLMTPELAKDAQTFLEDGYTLWVERYGKRWARSLFHWHAFLIASRTLFDGVVSRIAKVASIFKPS